MKPGLATTEFWVSLAVAAFGGLQAAQAGGLWDKLMWVALIAVSVVGYTASRTRLKQQKQVTEPTPEGEKPEEKEGVEEE